jgi:hypothetical protein
MFCGTPFGLLPARQPKMVSASRKNGDLEPEKASGFKEESFQKSTQ